MTIESLPVEQAFGMCSHTFAAGRKKQLGLAQRCEAGLRCSRMPHDSTSAYESGRPTPSNSLQKAEASTGCPLHRWTIRVEVRDTGTGIPEEEQKASSEAFYRLKHLVRGRRNGLGLRSRNALGIASGKLDSRASLARKLFLLFSSPPGIFRCRPPRIRWISSGGRRCPLYSNRGG